MAETEVNEGRARDGDTEHEVHTRRRKAITFEGWRGLHWGETWDAKDAKQKPNTKCCWLVGIQSAGQVFWR